MRSRWLASLGLGIVAGCIGPRAYPCASDQQCVLEGVQGRCESTNFCSYPDAQCPSEYRYETHAGEGLGQECVEERETSGDGTTGSMDLGMAGPCEQGECGCAHGLFSGVESTCARGSDGLVYCWGSNVGGRLGVGSTAQSFATPQPMVLPPGTSITLIAAKEHACALLDDDNVYCWGPNDRAQSDWTEPTVSVDTPRLVQQLGFVPDVLAVGYGLSCAAAGTTLHCWGGTPPGQTSLPPGPPDPELARLPDAVRHLAVGANHGCVSLETEEIYCFGSDDLGQLGDGPAQGQPGTVARAELPEHEAVLAMDAGHSHTCAVLQIGDSQQVLCWGDNSVEQSGVLGDTLELPRAVANLSPGDYVALAISEGHGCVVEASGALYCWGSNEYGKSDPWAQEWSFGAHEVTPPDEEITVADVAAGRRHTCVQLADRRVFCWGCNELQQLGPQHDGNGCDPGAALFGEVPLPCAEPS